MIKLKSILCEFDTKDDYILVGSVDVDDNFKVVAHKYNKSNINNDHDALQHKYKLFNPKNWRMRSDDKIVRWWSEPTETEIFAVNEWIKTKLGFIPKGHFTHQSVSSHTKGHKW